MHATDAKTDVQHNTTGKNMTGKKSRRWVAGAAALVLLMGAGGWLAKGMLTPKPPIYMTVPVEKRDIRETVSATGLLKASKEVDVGAQVSGQLQTLKVALGDKVKKGDLLGVIDPSLKENDLKNAESQLKNVLAQKRSQEALLKKYTLEYARQQEMSQSDAAARADLESAEANLESTQAEIEALDAQIVQAKTAVDTATTNLGYTRISAPMDGVVVALEAGEGQTLNSVQSAPTLLVLADLATMTVKAQISEADVIKVKPGLPVYFNILGDPETRYESILKSVEPAPESISDTDTSAKTVTSSAIYYNGQFDVKNPEGKLRIFMTAQVSIILGEAKGALSIPLSVLGAGSGNRYEVEILKEGAPEKRSITTGLRDNVYVEVLEGLGEEDRVVVGDSATAAAAATSSAGVRRGPPPM